MNNQDKQQFCEALNQYLMKRFQYKRKPAYISLQSGLIAAKRKLFDLYLRWLPGETEWGKDTLVIARIHFHQKRVGHGTSLLNFLIEQAPRCKYRQIAIEFANDNSAAFAKRYGFKNNAGTRDWIKKLPTSKP
ncbi:GNAT family N-acetyltransferase [Sansalvadorimonas verongulae]|uniref:GNAT family N-acetyltransferase n=1 Tax=Sansalvadorimonas verongulae TaxID=2172824 RepID=UPI0012BC9E35|nr:GNAT family N-acetyltransferase [Sansalvadorimonas verongulae]MTI12132.1 GNAT family N-acetyltransferase [Sansalvadorimonas verongulae]